MSTIQNKKPEVITVKCGYCNADKDVKLSKYNKNKTYYCCHKHYTLSKRKEKISTCKVCKVNFNGNFKDFCSITCEDKYSETHKFEIKQCKNCNNEFKSFNKKKQYCSLDCGREFNKKNNMKELTCEYCGNKFKTIHNSRFCSTRCSSKHFAPIIGFGSKIRPKEVWNKDMKNCFNEETLKKISDKITLSIIEGRKNKDNWSGAGFRDDLGHYLRSKWEANFARIILFENKTYEFEKKRFQLSNGTYYIPDFYVIEENCFYEIKGYFIDDAKYKFELFKKEYPHIKIKLIYHNEYKDLCKQYKNKIANWE